MQVVTGAAGFIGSHLVDRLLSTGEEVVGIDSFDDYYDRAAKERNLQTALSHPSFRFIHADLTELDLSNVLTSGDVIFHLAGQPGVSASWGTQFDRYVRNNVLATQCLLEASVRAGVRRVVYGSSSSVYGDQLEQPTSERALPKPVSPYGVTKLAAEHLVQLYGGMYRLSTVALRFFTVYGPRQRPDMAFHRFFAAIANGEPIRLNGQGRWRRDFTFVDDIVDGVVAAAVRGPPGSTFNLGGGTPSILLDAVDEMARIAGQQAQVTLVSGPGGEPTSTFADCRRAREELDFHPKVPLADGLRRQWEWQRPLIRGATSRQAESSIRQDYGGGRGPLIRPNRVAPSGVVRSPDRTDKSAGGHATSGWGPAFDLYLT